MTGADGAHQPHILSGPARDASTSAAAHFRTHRRTWFQGQHSGSTQPEGKHGQSPESAGTQGCL